MNVDRADLVREVKARTERDASDEVLVVVLLDLHAVQSRGAEYISITVTDGLPGMMKASETVFPQTRHKELGVRTPGNQVIPPS